MKMSRLFTQRFQNCLRGGARHSLYGTELILRGGCDGFHGAESGEQRLSPAGTDAGNLFQTAVYRGVPAQGTVKGDRVAMRFVPDALDQMKSRADLLLVDFHAEATSEKLAMGWYLDGRVSAVWGTHTHVPTADEKILPGGTGYVTDLGMTGPARSVLGIRPADSINTFLGGIPRRYMAADGPRKLESVLFSIDTETRRCVEVRRVDLSEAE